MNSRFPFLLLSSIAFAQAHDVQAQVNDKGTVHLSLGLAMGGHATEYDRTLVIGNLRLNQKSTGGAATVTVPLEVHVGLTPGFSLGAYLESGVYLDSNDAHTNRIRMFGIQPRFFLVNKERFAWTASAQLGATALTIEAEESFGNSKSTFRGGHFGLATGVIFHVSDLIGLRFDLRLLNNRLPLREYVLNDRSIDLRDFEAELRARGAAFQFSLGFKF